MRDPSAWWLGLCVLASLLAATDAPAATITGSPRPFVCTDNGKGKIFVVTRSGRIGWEYAAPGCQDVWMLPNGNLLFNHRRGVKVVTRDKKVVFEFKTKGECHACQPLPNGHTLVGECGVPRLLEVDRSGTIRKEIRLKTKARNAHLHMRIARKLANGHYLVCFVGEGVVRELDADGKVLREIKAGEPFAAVRLPNGNTLISCGRFGKLIEVDPAGNTVWTLDSSDLPGISLKWNAGFQRLPNGNTVLCNWLGHRQHGTAPHIIEVTRDKKIVWTFADHKLLRQVSNIQVLDIEGDVTKGEILR